MSDVRKLLIAGLQLRMAFEVVDDALYVWVEGFDAPGVLTRGRLEVDHARGLVRVYSVEE